MDELRQWLESMNLGKYADKFEEEEYESKKFLIQLTDSEYSAMVNAVGLKAGAAAKLKQKLDELKKQTKKTHRNVYEAENQEYKLRPIEEKGIYDSIYGADDPAVYTSDPFFSDIAIAESRYQKSSTNPYKKNPDPVVVDNAYAPLNKQYGLTNDTTNDANPYQKTTEETNKLLGSNNVTQQKNAYAPLNKQYGLSPNTKRSSVTNEPNISRVLTNPYSQSESQSNVEETDENGGVDLGVLKKQQNAVCCIIDSTSDNCGTGFLARYGVYIGIMTNHHVIGNKLDCKRWKPIFNYKEKEKKEIEVELTPDIFFITSTPLDITFVSCKHKIATKEGIVPFPLSNNKRVVEKDQIHIFQHPDGRPQEKASHIVTKSENNFFHYQADTEGGSSGAPVFLNSKIVGVHHGYNPKIIANEGIHMDIILGQLIDKELESKNGGSTTITNEKTKEEKLAEIKTWLQEQKLVQYFDAFDENGYCDLEKIKTFDQAEIKAMIKAIGFKKGSAKKIETTLEELKQNLSNVEQRKKKRGKRMQEVYEWLCTLNIGHYADKFEEEEYDSMRMMKDLTSDEIDEMATNLGLKMGAVAKIKQNLL